MERLVEDPEAGALDADVLGVVLLAMVPGLATFLPDLMLRR